VWGGGIFTGGVEVGIPILTRLKERLGQQRHCDNGHGDEYC